MGRDCSGGPAPRAASQRPEEPPRFSIRGCCPMVPAVSPPAPALCFSLGAQPLRPAQPPPWTVPSSRASLGFDGCHVPIHVIGLPVVLVWASYRVGRCFPRDRLCDPRADGQRVHTHRPSPVPATTPPAGKAPLDGVSVPSSLGFARGASCGEQGECDAVRAAGWAAGQEDPTSGGHGVAEGGPGTVRASAAADVPEASLWNQLDWP